MRSSIKIDFIDRGTGKGIEPVIRVEIKKSEDPRDTLITTLFQSLRDQEFLQLRYTNHTHIAVNGLPDMEKQVLLFKPEYDTNELWSIVRHFFHEWILAEKYELMTAEVEYGKSLYTKGSKTYMEKDLFVEFLSIKATHSGN